MTESINYLNNIIISLVHRGIRQKDIAEFLYCSPSYINKLYKGHRIRASPIFLHRLIEIYSVNPDYLTGGIEPMFLEASPEGKTDTFVAEDIAEYGFDKITLKIASLIKDMPEEERREFLRHVEEKKLLREIREEREKEKG